MVGTDSPNEKKGILSIVSSLMIDEVPSYANRFFYSLGFLALISFTMLILTGTIEVFFGPTWWLVNPVGQFVRSLHMWSTQAFVLFIILHLTIVFFTAGFASSRKLTWVIGVLMFLFVMSETEFGYLLRGDFSSQWRSLQGADFYNGSGLGYLVNTLNYTKVFGIHIILIPLAVLILAFSHYVLVKVRGIATPVKATVKYSIVKADHRILFLRGGILILVIGMLAILLPSPYVKPVTVAEIAKSDPKLLAATWLAELEGTSDTATYVDNIAPYTFDTRSVFVEAPYRQLIASSQLPDLLGAYDALPEDVQKKQLEDAKDYFTADQSTVDASGNVLIGAMNQMTGFASTGLYESALRTAAEIGDNTYLNRFLADTGVLESQADTMGLTTDQYGMLREESITFIPGAWWLAPIGVLDHTVLSQDDNQDRDGAIILGLFILLMAAFPFIPGLNRIPEYLGFYKIFQKDSSNPGSSPNKKS